MTTTNKQTLFRFRTMRNPGLLSSDAKINFFITHPDGTSGPFYAALVNIAEWQTKEEALIDAAASFTELESVEDVRALATDLFDFGTLLLKKRKTITYTTAVTEIDGLTELSDGEVLQLWDNFFYQNITLKSGPVREAILQLLLANHFLAKFDIALDNDKITRKLARSRIVIPTELFGIENPYSRATAAITPQPNLSLLQKHIDTAVHELNAKLGTAALEEVQQYKKTFFRTELPKEVASIGEHFKDVGDAIKAGTTTVETDSFSGNKVKRVTASIPTFSFTRVQEIVKTNWEDKLSPTTIYLINSLGLLDTCVSFDQVEQGLKSYIQTNRNVAFQRTSFHVEKLAVDGTLLSKCSLETRSNNPLSFVLKPVLQFENNYKIVLCFDAGSSCLKIESLLVYVNPFELSSLAYSNKDGIITIDLTPNGGISLPDVTSVNSVGGWIRFTSGLQLNFSPLTLDLSKQISGILQVGATDSSTSQLTVPTGFGITRLGVADYRKVEQTLCCYVPGEVSHIENIMAREYKERSTRRLRRSEDTTTSSSSTEREHQTDTTSTSRYELQSEISQVLSESRENSMDMSAHGGLSGGNNTTGNYDASFDVSSNFANSTSQENSNNQSTTFAKEITEKALDRVLTKVSEERVNKIIEEFEEQNRHGFDNRQGAEHISGVYRWVDKVYKNQIHNYGARLQYEFMIPEPASFHTMAKMAVSASGSETPVRKPLDPRLEQFGQLTPMTHAALVNEDNYQQWAAAYGASVLPPPDMTKVIGKSVIRPQDGSPWHESKVVNEQLQLPEGYGINRIYINALGNGDNSNWERYYVSVAGVSRVYWTGVHESFLHAEDTSSRELDKFTDVVPITVQFTGLDGGLVSVELQLIRRPSHFAEWQLDTFNTIIEAYENRLQDYKDAVAELGIQKAQLLADNPAYFRRIEHTVLKKNCIAYLIGHTNMGKSFITGETMNTTHVQLNATMDRYASIVKFFEQAFEWNIMDYTFYPFYWAGRSKWNALYTLDNDDALFRAFLQSGMARTTVSVRPGFEEAVMFYMETGQIWNGSAAPIIGDDLYLSIMEELDDPEYYIDETWETRVPSSLTVIQAKTIALNTEGLPCYCDEENPPVETIEQPAVNPLEGLEVFISGNTPETPVV